MELERVVWFKDDLYNATSYTKSELETLENSILHMCLKSPQNVSTLCCLTTAAGEFYVDYWDVEFQIHKALHNKFIQKKERGYTRKF